MNIFGIGLPEMVLIFIVALLIFGPKKLPEIGKTLGKTIKSFQEASKEFEAEIKKEIDTPSPAAEPAKPMEATIVDRDPPQLTEGHTGESIAEVEKSAENG